MIMFDSLSNLLVALEAITKAIDEGNVVDMIYFAPSIYECK